VEGFDVGEGQYRGLCSVHGRDDLGKGACAVMCPRLWALFKQKRLLHY